MMLARDGTLYYSFKDYPYTACGYTPIFYLLEAMVSRAGIPAVLGGRFISFTAMLVSFALCWRLPSLSRLCLSKILRKMWTPTVPTMAQRASAS